MKNGRFAIQRSETQEIQKQKFELKTVDEEDVGEVVFSQPTEAQKAETETKLVKQYQEKKTKRFRLKKLLFLQNNKKTTDRFQKPAIQGEQAQTQKNKWHITFLFLFLTTLILYVSSYEIALHVAPDSDLVALVYKPMSIVRDYFPAVEKYQKECLRHYVNFFG